MRKRESEKWKGSLPNNSREKVKKRGHPCCPVLSNPIMKGGIRRVKGHKLGTIRWKERERDRVTKCEIESEKGENPFFVCFLTVCLISLSRYIRPLEWSFHPYILFSFARSCTLSFLISFSFFPQSCHTYGGYISPFFLYWHRSSRSVILRPFERVCRRRHPSHHSRLLFSLSKFFRVEEVSNFLYKERRRMIWSFLSERERKTKFRTNPSLQDRDLSSTTTSRICYIDITLPLCHQIFLSFSLTPSCLYFLGIIVIVFANPSGSFVQVKNRSSSTTTGSL